MLTARRLGLLALALALLAAGCVSTAKRYDKALDLEAEGRYAEAADYYVKVLEREPDYEDARARLREVGARAVDQFLDEANALEEAARFDAAMAALEALDALRARAAGVGVPLGVPADYADYRRELQAQAVEELVARAERALAERDFEAALAAYERAGRYDGLPPERRAGLEDARAGVLLRWSQADLDAGRFRSAFDRAAAVLERFGPDTEAGRRALGLQDEALAAGTVVVAFTPVWRTDGAGRDAGASLLAALNDELEYTHWTAPPRFVAAAEPVEVRRELRRLRLDRATLSTREAVDLGRSLGVDLVLTGEVTLFEVRDTDVRERTRKAKWRARRGAPSDTSYVERSFRRELRARLEYRLVDPQSRREVERGTVEARADARLTRGLFPGDYRDLDLSSRERDLFDSERLRGEDRDLEDRLAAELARALADRVFADVLRRVR